ncbi:MAG: hypothetical protein U1E36_02255 [Rickettsiales bacterium]
MVALMEKALKVLAADQSGESGLRPSKPRPGRNQAGFAAMVNAARRLRESVVLA